MPIILFSTGMGGLLISFTVTDRLQRDALQNKMQLIGSKLKALRIQVKGRHFKGALLQSAVKDRKPALLIHQQLQVRTWTVDEDERIALRNLPAQFIGNNAAKLVKAFAHVRLFAVKMIRTVSTQ